MADAAITAIEKQAANFDAVYGKCADARYTINAVKGEGTLIELLEFVAK
jgi:CRISPR system Cascade subunit CasC